MVFRVISAAADSAVGGGRFCRLAPIPGYQKNTSRCVGANANRCDWVRILYFKGKFQFYEKIDKIENENFERLTLTSSNDSAIESKKKSTKKNFCAEK